MNVVLYARVSSEDQAEKDISIPAQRKELRAFCDRNDYRVVAEFADEGVSAYGPAEKRKQFMAMLDYCVSHAVDAVLVVRFDRFSRNQKESIIFKGVLRRHNVRVISISEPIDTSTPAGELHEGMIELINQYYSRLLSVMVRKGINELIDQGFWPGNAPMGYRLEPDGEHSRLVPGDEGEIALIREIFRLAHQEKMGALRIVNALTGAGYRPPRARVWRSSVIHTILRNPVYKGTLVWGSVTKHEGRRTKQADPEKIVTIPNYVPALIEPEVWEEVQEAIKRRPFGRRRHLKDEQMNYLLGRLLRCPCGSTFGGHLHYYSVKSGERRSYGYYRCYNQAADGKHACKSRMLPMQDADQKVLSMVRSYFSPERLAQVELSLLEQLDEQKKSFLTPAKLEQQLEELDGQIERYYQAIGTGLDPMICKRLIGEIESKKEALKEKAAKLREQADTTRYAQEQLREARERIAILASGFDELPMAGQRDVLLSLVQQVNVLDEGHRLQVVMHLPLKNKTDEPAPSAGPLRKRKRDHGSVRYLQTATDASRSSQSYAAASYPIGASLAAPGQK